MRFKLFTKAFVASNILVLLVLSGCNWSGSIPASKIPPARFEKTDCEMPVHMGDKVECGYLYVPEDRTQPDGRQIRLAIAIVQSTNPNPLPDPVVYLHGGPGFNSLGTLTAIPGNFNWILSNRDLIVFDQRGVGYSQPSLNCPEIDALHFQDITRNISDDESRVQTARAFQECRERLVKEGINPNAYSSAASAADVNDLRIALGYSKWNLYGSSYGTRLALTVMRDYPEGVRSAILDSVLPLQVDTVAGAEGNAHTAFDLIFTRCAMNEQCDAMYPNLKNVFYETVSQLNSQPVRLKIIRSSTGQTYEAVLNGDRFVTLLVNLLSFTDTLPHLPGMIYDLHAGRTDFSPELIPYLNIVAASQDYISEGARQSVMCRDQVSFSSPQKVQEVLAAQPSPLWDLPAALGDFDKCEVWDVQPATPIENQPVVSDIPTLILEGDMDPITPPAWGKLAGETLKNSYYEEFVWVAHGVYGAGQLPLCSKMIVKSFLENPQMTPDAACLSKLEIFFVTE